MLVRFAARCPWRPLGAFVWLSSAACTLVVGELPEPVPEDGPLAGGGSSSSASSGGQGGVAAAGSSGGDAAQGGDANPECDQDGDEHLARGKCGGDDCDDSDADVSPDQTEYFADRDEVVGYDYDCSGGPEQEQQAAVVCSGLTVGPCPTDETGFLGSLPACGEVGRWGICIKTPPLDTCDEMVRDELTRMRCH